MTLFWRISEMLAVTQASENVFVLGTLQFVYLLDFNYAGRIYVFHAIHLFIIWTRRVDPDRAVMCTSPTGFVGSPTASANWWKDDMGRMICKVN